MVFGNSATTAASTTEASTSKDVALPTDATDTISSVRWSPARNHLAAGSWDGKMRIYDITADGSARGLSMLSADGPVFSCDWSKVRFLAFGGSKAIYELTIRKDGNLVAAGGADKKLHILDAATGQTMTIGSHDAPVRGVRFVDVLSASSPIIATGSWDKTVRYWDMRMSNPHIFSLDCADRVYCMDSASKLLVVGTAEQHIHLVDLAQPTKFLRTTESPLKHQTTAVAAFPDGKGWATAGIEGRCGINGVEEYKNRVNSINFTFRCHRDAPDAQRVVKVWTVRDVNFHPVHTTTFSTAGADGTFHFWDRVAHQRLRGFSPVGGAITSTGFNRDGTIFAYAVGYDWSHGYAKNRPDYPVKLMLHPVDEAEVKPKARVGGR